jgi:hypothetical protein
MHIKKGDRINPTIFSTRQVEARLTCDASCNQKKMQFESEYKDWIDVQNMQFEHQGLWCDDSRPW